MIYYVKKYLKSYISVIIIMKREKLWNESIDICIMSGHFVNTFNTSGKIEEKYIYIIKNIYILNILYECIKKYYKPIKKNFFFYL